MISEHDLDGLDGRLAEALDRCLARMRAGASAAACLADYPDLAADLAPLLDQGSELRAARVEAPPPPTGLALGRARFLEAASRARLGRAQAGGAVTAAAAVDLEDPRLEAAFDAALERLRAGEPSERVVGAFPALAPALAPLLATAGQVVGGVVAPPRPPRGLKPARAHFLALAAERRAAQTALPSGWRARLAALVSGGGAGRARRAVWATMAMLLVFMASSAAVGTAAGDALPGDALYGVKRLGEQVRWALALSPAARSALESDLSQARARELVGLMQAGREAELAWQARFLRLDGVTGAGLSGAWLVVEPLGSGGAAEPVALLWTTETAAELGALAAAGGPAAAFGLLPPGSRLALRVMTRDGGPPWLLAVVLLEPLTWAEAPGTPVVAAASAEPETATPEPATPTASATHLPLTPSPTATAAVQPSPSPTGTAVATALPGEEEPPEDTLNGVLSRKPSALSWEVADDGQGGRLVDVDVGAVSAERRDAVQVGYQVKLVGRWVGTDGSRFRASSLLAWQAPSCDEGRFDNAEIASYSPGVALTLVGQAGEFLIVAESEVQGMLGPGVRVDLVYRDCHNGRREILSVGPAAIPATVERGIILSLGADWTFVMENENGDPITVRYGPAVAITGQATVLRLGQVVDVRGHWDAGDPTVLLAEAIVVYRDAATAPVAETPGAPLPPSATPAPPPSMPTAPAGGATQ